MRAAAQYVQWTCNDAGAMYSANALFHETSFDDLIKIKLIISHKVRDDLDM